MKVVVWLISVGLGGILESLLLRIQLTDDAVIVTDLRGRKRYDVAAIDGIEEAKGGPPVYGWLCYLPGTLPER